MGAGPDWSATYRRRLWGHEGTPDDEELMTAQTKVIRPVLAEIDAAVERVKNGSYGGSSPSMRAADQERNRVHGGTSRTGHRHRAEQT